MASEYTAGHGDRAKIRRRVSVILRVIALLLAAFLPVLGIGSILIVSVATHNRDDLAHQVSLQAFHAVDELEGILKAELAEIQALATSQYLDNADLEGFREQSRRLHALNPLWYTVVLSTPDGRNVFNLLRAPEDEPLPIVDRQSFDQVLQAGRPLIGGLSPPSTVSQLRLVPLRVPVFRDNELRYILTIVLTPHRIAEILQTLTPKDWLGAVVDQNARLVARTRESEKFVGGLAPKEAREVIASGQVSGFYETRALSGEDATVVYRISPLSGWSVHFIIPRDTLDLRLNRSLALAIAGATLAAAIGAAFLWIVHKDFANQREREAALRASEERLRAARDAARMGIFDHDLTTGELKLDERCHEIWGTPPGTTVGIASVMAAIHPDDRPLVEAAVAEAQNPSGPGRYCVEYRVVNLGNGVERWVAVAGQVYFSESTVCRFVGAVQEVTERKQREAELIKAKDAAEAGDRAKSSFLATMSHELRTPLNAIIGYSELLEKGFGGPLTDKQVGYVADVLNSGRHLLSLVNDVLQTATIVAGQTKISDGVVDLAAMLTSCCSLIATNAEQSGSKFTHSVASRLPCVRGDEGRLKQVVLNLMSNAIKFSHPGGTVELAAHVADDGGVVIEVRDTGIGMSPDEIKVALQPFGQIGAALSRRYEGAGLGLPLAQKLVKLHQGSLTIESAPSHGTCARVWLPPNRVLPLAF